MSAHMRKIHCVSPWTQFEDRSEIHDHRHIDANQPNLILMTPLLSLSLSLSHALQAGDSYDSEI